MAKTIAEVHGFTQLLAERLDETRRLVAELKDAQVRSDIALTAERAENARLRQELAETRKQLEEERATGRARDEKIAEIQAKGAAHHSRGEEHAKQIEQLHTRVWGLIALLLVAALSFIGYSLRK